MVLLKMNKIFLVIFFYTINLFAQAQGLRSDSLFLNRLGLNKGSVLNAGDGGIDFPDGNNITISTDSLKFYIEFYKDRGFGKSTYAQKMPSLYVHGTRNGDTLQLGATSNAETDDPTDSTGFGYLWFDGTNDGMKTTTPFYLDTNFTIVMKFRAYGTAGYLIEPVIATVFLYGSTGTTWRIGTSLLDYYSNWGVKADDSVTIVTDSMQLYRNGILRVSLYSNLNTAYSTTIFVGCRNLVSGFSKMRLGSLAIWNKRLTIAEILMWND